jgi:hypothetical protein
MPAKFIVVLIAILIAAPALAGDGVLEINQTCAVQTGCFSGDAAGFPVRLPQSGSYRLTSNLTVTGSTQAISSSITLSDVSIDLNGFTIEGSGSNNGIQLWSGDNWEIRNGTIKGFNIGVQQAAFSDGHRIIRVRVSGNAFAGILIGAGAGHLVQDCTAIGNGKGIQIGASSSAVGNTVAGNTDRGLTLGLGTGYGSNVVNDNTGGTVSGGVEIGTNVCDGTTVCP